LAEPIGSLRAELGLAIARFEQDMGRAVKAVRRGSARMRRAFARARTSAVRFAKSLISLRSAAVAAAGIGGLFFLVKRSIDAADTIAKVARATSLSAEALQEFRFAARRGGIEIEKTDKALLFFIKNMAELRTRTSSEMGLALQEFNPGLVEMLKNTKNQEEALRLLADAIQDTDSALEKTAIARAAFGRSGALFVTTLNEGSAGLDRMARKARTLGAVLSNEIIARSEVAADELGDMADALRIAGIAAALQLMPAMRDLARMMTSPDFISGLKNLSTLVLDATEFFVKFHPEILAVAAAILVASTALKLGGKKGVQLALILGPLAGLLTVLTLRLRETTDETKGLNVAQTEQLSLAERLEAEVRKGLDAEKARVALIKQVQKAIQVEIDTTSRQLDQLGTSRAEWKRLTALRKAYEVAQKLGLVLTEEEIAQLVKEARQVKVLAERVEELTAQKKKDEEATKEGTRAADELGVAFSSAFEDAILRGEKLSNVLNSLLEDIARIAFQETITRPFTGFLRDLFSGFMGFRHGGQFTVGGSGGADSQMVAFKATPGETVTVGTPGAQVSTSPVMVRSEVEVNVFAPPGTEVQTRESAIQGARRLDILLDEQMAKSIVPGTRTFRAIQGAFAGMTPSLVGR